MSKRSPRQNSTEERMVRSLDKLAQFEELETDVLPLLRQFLKDGWTAEQIEKHPKVQAAVVARQLTIALTGTGKEMGAALAAIKDTRNRTSGKPVDKMEVTSKLEKMPTSDLDALLLSKLNDANDDSEEELPN